MFVFKKTPQKYINVEVCDCSYTVWRLICLVGTLKFVADNGEILIIQFKTLFILTYYWYYNWKILKLVFVLYLFLWGKKNKIKTIDIPDIPLICWWQQQDPFLLLRQRWSPADTHEVFFTLFAKLSCASSWDEESNDCPEDGIKTWFGYFPPKPNVFQPTCSGVFNANRQTHHMFYSAGFEIWMNSLACLYSYNCSQDWLYLCIFISVQPMLVPTNPLWASVSASRR